MERLGELAAFGTAICWTVSAIFFERASKRIGALAVNFYKVCAAFVLLAIAGYFFRDMPLPLDAPLKAWIWLPISGLVGFIIADYFLFNAYILIGSRLTILFQPLTPLVTALLGFLILGERMRTKGLIGMGLVVAGILIAVVSRNLSEAAAAVKAGDGKARPRGLRDYLALLNPQGAGGDAKATKGFVFAFASAIFQAVGLIFTKLGLGDYDAISGTQIRVGTAIIGFALQALLFGQARQVFAKASRDRSAMLSTAGGAVFGPFVGVTLSLVALQSTSAGAASTLMGLTPILIIPAAIFILKQNVRALEIVGACVAVAGAALFFLL